MLDTGLQLYAVRSWPISVTLKVKVADFEILSLSFWLKFFSTLSWSFSLKFFSYFSFNNLYIGR